MAPSSADAHRFDRVEADRGAYVLVCSCGWRSAPSSSAEVVGSEWDDHLVTAA
jgi:hypothetical protein